MCELETCLNLCNDVNNFGSAQWELIPFSCSSGKETKYINTSSGLACCCFEYPRSGVVILSLSFFADLPEGVPSITKDDIIISFECRPFFSNVMDLKITAVNTSSVIVEDVAMELESPHVRYYTSVYICHH